MNSKTLSIAVLNNEWIELKLLWYSYLDRYFNSNGWKLEEILISYRDNSIWVYLAFKKDIELKYLKTIMGIDINFDSIAYTVIDFNRNIVSMSTIPFNGLKRALRHKILIEGIQRRYSKEWRFVKGIRDSIKKHGHRMRNILIDSCHYISRRIVEIAKEYNSIIVLEDLNKLRNNANGSKSFNKRLSLWAYRKIQSYIEYKVLLEGIQTIFDDPHNSFKESSIGDKLKFINYRWVKLPNGHIITRDLAASWNLVLRGCSIFDICRKKFISVDMWLLFKVRACLGDGSNAPSLGRCNLDGSPVPLDSTTTHEPVGIIRALWARWNSLDVTHENI